MSFSSFTLTQSNKKSVFAHYVACKSHANVAKCEQSKMSFSIIVRNILRACCKFDQDVENNKAFFVAEVSNSGGKMLKSNIMSIYILKNKKIKTTG